MAIDLSITRRDFIRRTGGLAAGAALPVPLLGSSRPRAEVLRVAAVFTALYYRSHAHVTLENFVAPYLFNGQWIEPGVRLVSLYADQFPARDLCRQFSAKYGIPIYPTIAGALGCGKAGLAVDAVLCIGEHGQYPFNEKGQHLYPRKRFYDEITAVFRRSGRVVPVWNDKHLSYRWDWAREMYDTAREMKIPLLAGSSAPLAQRRPPLELPVGPKITEAVAIYLPGPEVNDFHSLEVIQSMVEAREGGETGVAEVRFLESAALWRAAEAGEWSPDLARAAFDADPDPGVPSGADAIRPPNRNDAGPPFVRYGVLVKYRSGLCATLLGIPSPGIKWHFACRLAGENAPRAGSFYSGPWEGRNLFKALSHAIQTHFREGAAPYPLERTLLTTGVVDAAMESRFRHGDAIETPHLAISYPARDFRPMREMGASWKILTEAVPEPKGLDLWKPA